MNPTDASSRPSLVPILLAVVGCAGLTSGLAGQDSSTVPANDRPIEPDLQPLYTVGGIDGPEWSSFATLDGAAFGPNGRLYLLDATTDRVVAVDAGGESGGVVGGRGDGPGEYRDPGGLLALADGRLAVWDGRKRRFLLYAADGASITEVAPDIGAGVPSPPLRPGGDGSVLALPLRLVSGRRGGLYQTGRGFQAVEQDVPLLRVPVGDEAPVRIVTWVPWPQAGADDPATLAFVPEANWGGLADDRIALAHTDRYEIVLLDAGGQPRDTLRRAVEARPTTASDEDAFRAFVRERYERSVNQAAGSGLRPTPPSEEVRAHPVIPPIRRITTDGRDRIWVERPDPADPTRPGPIDVLAAEGRYIGTVVDSELGLPAAFGPDGLVVFLTRTELDVPVARVFRLPPGLR